MIDAYNGVRVRLSKKCVEDPRCRERANAGFEIVGNTFEKIRDNAIEPEDRAAYWIIKHNTFIDDYAPISTDSVVGTTSSSSATYLPSTTSPVPSAWTRAGPEGGNFCSSLAETDDGARRRRKETMRAAPLM